MKVTTKKRVTPFQTEHRTSNNVLFALVPPVCSPPAENSNLSGVALAGADGRGVCIRSGSCMCSICNGSRICGS
jgi:hypothetical protein